MGVKHRVKKKRRASPTCAPVIQAKIDAIKAKIAALKRGESISSGDEGRSDSEMEIAGIYRMHMLDAIRDDNEREEHSRALGCFSEEKIGLAEFYALVGSRSGLRASTKKALKRWGRAYATVKM